MDGIREYPHEIGWRYSINHGPDGETKYAMVYTSDGFLVGNLETHYAIKIVNAVNAAVVASNTVEMCAKAAEKQIAPWVKEKAGDYWEGYRDAIEDAVEDIRAISSSHLADATKETKGAADV